LSEKSTNVVDANVIVSLLLGAERKDFERARAFFESAREGRESAYVLTRGYGVSREDAAVKLSTLLDYRGVETESGAVRRALALFRERNVDFVDALVAATAAERGWRVFSFDRDLERLAR